MLEVGPAVIKLVCCEARRMTNKINAYQGMYYKENKQDCDISLLEKRDLLKGENGTEWDSTTETVPAVQVAREFHGAAGTRAWERKGAWRVSG